MTGCMCRQDGADKFLWNFGGEVSSNWPFEIKEGVEVEQYDGHQGEIFHDGRMAQDSVPWWALALAELNYLGLPPASELVILLVK